MLTFELVLAGLFTGLLSGFFGIGGGTILVPILLLIGYEMKDAIVISITQMVFSSVYGSFLNLKKNRSIFKDGIIIGLGGFAGGLQSGFLVSNVSGLFLQYLFLLILSFSIIRVFITPHNLISTRRNTNKIYLFILGFFIGIIAMSIGVGGSILLSPILIGFFKYDSKTSTAIGLFFVIFSSFAGFISNFYHGNILFYEGLIIGIASLVGVYFGIELKNLVQNSNYKKYILIFYILVFFIMIYKLFF